MSLICHETGKFIEFGDPLMGGARSGVNTTCALSQDVLKKIPNKLRRCTPCAPNEEGVNIHVAISERSGEPEWLLLHYSYEKFRRCDFLFSVSRDVAIIFLQNTLATLDTDQIKLRA